ncbi:MAG: hypothetical protein U9Q03_01300 [Patescibacteria group bacterium]|nr:hypothetical protein [Patescibacteria group bacterium]
MDDRNRLATRLARIYDLTRDQFLAFMTLLSPFFSSKDGGICFKLANEDKWTARRSEVRDAISTAVGEEVTDIHFISLNKTRELPNLGSWPKEDELEKRAERYRSSMDWLIMNSLGEELSEVVFGDYLPHGMTSAMYEEFERHIVDRIDEDRALDDTMLVTLSDCALGPIKCVGTAICEGDDAKVEQTTPLLKLIAQGVIVLGRKWDEYNAWLVIIA